MKLYLIYASMLFAWLYFGCSSAEVGSESKLATDSVQFNFLSSVPMRISKQAYSKGLEKLRLDTFHSSVSPDSIYALFQNEPIFSSEAGKDYFFEIYALYAAQKLDPVSDRAKLNQLIRGYCALNEMNNLLNHGSAAYGHQLVRIPSYAIHDFLSNRKLSGEIGNEDLDSFILRIELRMKQAIKTDGWFEKGSKDRKRWENELLTQYKELTRAIRQNE